MEKRIVVIEADGSTRELSKAPTLAEMQKILGGFIEHVRILDRVEGGKFIYTSMYVNETGLLDGLPRNEKATTIYQRNIRAQYSNSPNPFKTSREEWLADMEKRGVKVIDASPPEFNHNDPFIAGPAILFEGYICDEADAEI